MPTKMGEIISKDAGAKYVVSSFAEHHDWILPCMTVKLNEWNAN